MADDIKAVVQRMIDAGESEENIASVIRAAQPKHEDAPAPPGTNSALTMAAAGASVPVVAQETMRFATSPSVPKVAEAVGKTVGVLASVPTSLTGLGKIERGATAGAKIGGWFGRQAQNVALPVAKALDAVKPYAQAVSTLSGAQGALDLAQMAPGESQRRDIGVLGIGGSMPDLEVLTKAVAKGANPMQAAAQIANGNPQKFAQLITAYSQSLRKPSDPQKEDPSWYRADGTRKGNGFLGVIQRPDGKVSSEISIGVNIGGKEVEVPTLVPTLSKQERDWLINNDVSDPHKIPTSIIQKATDHARQRLAVGKSPFAQDGEQVK